MGIVSRPGASVFFVSDGPISSNSGRNGGKNAGRNCVSALPQRATVGCDFPHLLAGITFCHRCRIKGLCLHSFPLPLPVATVNSFVLSCYGTTNISHPVPAGHTYPLRCFAPQWARFDNRHSISAPAPILSLHQRQRRERYKRSPEPTTLPTALHARVHTAKSA